MAKKKRIVVNLPVNGELLREHLRQTRGGRRDGALQCATHSAQADVGSAADFGGRMVARQPQYYFGLWPTDLPATDHIELRTRPEPGLQQ